MTAKPGRFVAMRPAGGMAPGGDGVAGPDGEAPVAGASRRGVTPAHEVVPGLLICAGSENRESL